MRGLRNILLCALLIGTFAQSSDDDCNCDILLILDRSGSLTANDWVLEKQFATTVVKGLAGNMPPQKVGVISFASNVRVDSPLTTDEDKVLAAIAASAKTNGATYMNLALDAAVTEFNKNGTPGKCKTAKIVTDGVSTVPALTKTAADKLKAAGITLIAIGVGNANAAELNYLATDPDSKNAILLKSFTNLDQLAHSWVDKCAAANTSVGQATTVNMNNCDTNYKFSYPFEKAVVPDTGRPVMQITADIESGCKTGDVLALNPAVAGITATWSAADCELKLTGAADITPFKWQTAVRNIRFTTTDVSAGPNIRTLTWTMGAGLFWSVNGHYYEFIKVPKITWKDANTQAKGQTRYGMQCYMATVTSGAENAFLLGKLHGSGWIGATDELTEGTFRWVTGPEGLEDGGKGRIFWTGGVTGKSFNGQYENWGNGEPNDYKPIGGEDYAHFWERINGEWNDFPNYHGDIDGYFLECGDGSAASTHYAETTKLVVFCNNCLRDTTCSKNGVCLPDGTCDCFDQFAGAACNTCAVNYINYPTCSHCLVVADKCSGKGCWDGTKCTCNAGFAGTNCDQCAPGFYGPNCVRCSPCYNGTCKAGKTGDGTCQCNTGFDPGTRCLDCIVPTTGPSLWGPLCNKNCPADCGHGHCDDGVLGTGQCVCSGNYTQASGCKDCPAGSYGPMCLPCPTHKCYRHGKCNEGIAGDGKCTCDPNFDPNTDCQLCVAGYTIITNSSAKLCPDHKDASGNTGNYDPKCTCDVVFSLDKSLSITNAQWPLVVSFVKQMVYGMKFTNAQGMRVAVTSFAHAVDSKKECPFAAVRADVIQCVDAIKRGTQGGTRTDLGFQYTLDFLKESEAATPGKCKAVYVVSDGAPWPSTVIPATNTLIKQIQSMPNTEVVAIGIGNVQMSMLQSWATAPIQDHAILLKDFDGLDHLAAMMSGQCPNGQDKLVEPNCHCDIVIVVDRSGSIAPFWTQVVDFMYTLAYGYDMNSNGTAMRVGLVSYSDNAKVESQITGNRDQLLTAIKGIATPLGGTNTAAALTAAKNELNARGRPGACKSIKLLTDGKSTNPAATLAAAQDIKATTNWTVVVIGIGGADKTEMDAIATPPLATNSLFLAATDLDDLAHTLATKCDNCVINPDACIAVIDCVVSDFSVWSACSSPCGGGQQTRKRTVIIWPGPGGKACPGLEETQPCNIQSCAIDCVVSDWGAWGACSANCGGGIRKRSRTILVAAQNGGAPCPALEESEACNTNYCPVDCVVSDWSAWGACSAPCNGGTQSRTRTITVAPLHGGVPCPPLTESQACNTVVCPPTCEFTPWTNWGPCDKTCGGGIQTRTRAPIPKDPAHCHCDIMLVLDRSGSIGTANWAKMVAFAMSLVNGFTFTNEFGMRLGITTFADNAKLECGMSFDKAALTACVNNMVYTRGYTRTDLGVATGFAELEAKKQPSKCRSMKIVTDGQATTKPIDLLWTEIAKVKAQSIDIYALGVDVSGGTDPVTVAAMTAQLQKMASDPVADHYQMLSNFDALDAVAKQLTGTCDQYTGVNGQTNPCPTNTIETQPCNLQPCPVDCVLGPWSTWTTCSLNCGGGTQTRSRIIEVQAQNGGAACPAVSTLTETQPCNTQDCAIDCVVGPWGSWSACTLPCGGGKQRRERSVLQAAANGGKPCPLLTEEQECNTQACPVDCVVTDWDPWTPCDKPCGSGVRHRERMILQQAANGGAPCPALKQTEACNTQDCPIDCVPGAWSDWSRCSKDCGLGTQTRTRSVAIPAQNGGLPCLPGDLIQTQECNPQPCPIDCVVGPYGDWGNCSVPCGGGTQMRERQITTIPANGGAPCPATQESRVCNQQECVTDCVVSVWSQWSTCSRACGTGTWTRTRTIITPPTGGAVCPPLNETQTCNDQPCPVDCVVGPWSNWAPCSLSCGGGVQLATRQILIQPQFGGAACPQDLQKTQSCNTDPCPVDCVLSDWSAWGACTVPCGSGTQSRIRTVVTAASNGGAACPTSLSESRPCNDQPCAIDCVVSAWSAWSTCNLNCGGGQQTRTRIIITKDNFGGVPCPPLVESQACNTSPCAVDCVVSTWSAWSPCSLTCGKGYTRRSRTVVTPASNGGAVCPDLEETMDCNDFPCPVNCVVSAWSAWGPCSAPCGGGEATRTRTITTFPANGGVACPQLKEHQPCNDQACPDVACVVSDWGEWSACSVECGGGVQTRSRSVRPLQQANGAVGVCPKTEQTKSCNTHACSVSGAQSSVIVA